MKTQSICLALLTLLVSSCATMKPTLPSATRATATDFPAYLKLADERITTYRNEVVKIENQEWSNGESTLFGGTVGTIGAVAHSIPAAAGGAVIAGTATLMSTFYGTEKQNDVYTKAFDAASCVRTIASNINKPEALQYIQAPDGGGTADTYAIQTLNGALDKIDGILLKRLKKRAVSSEPNFELFQTHLQNSLKSQPAQATATLPTPSGGVHSLAGGKTISSGDLDRLKTSIGRLKDDIGLCISAN